MYILFLTLRLTLGSPRKHFLSKRISKRIVFIILIRSWRSNFKSKSPTGSNFSPNKTFRWRPQVQSGCRASIASRDFSLFCQSDFSIVLRSSQENIRKNFDRTHGRRSTISKCGLSWIFVSAVQLSTYNHLKIVDQRHRKLHSPILIL